MNRVGSSLKRAAWEAGRYAGRLGVVLWLVVLLLVAITVFHLLVLAPQQRKLDEQRTLSKTSRQDVGRMVARVAQGAGTEDASLDRFYEFFRNDQSQSDVIARLSVTATDMGLTMRRIDYRPLPESSLRLAGFQIQLPLSGTYPDLRNFVSTILSRMPTVTLDQIEISRAKEGADLVEAQLLLSYYHTEPR